MVYTQNSYFHIHRLTYLNFSTIKVFADFFSLWTIFKLFCKKKSKKSGIEWWYLLNACFCLNKLTSKKNYVENVFWRVKKQINAKTMNFFWKFFLCFKFYIPFQIKVQCIIMSVMHVEVMFFFHQTSWIGFRTEQYEKYT